MRLCRRDELRWLLAQGKLGMELENGSEPVFLDEHRLGLRIGTVYRLSGEVNLQSRSRPRVELVDLTHDPLTPGTRYLGLSRERISLGDGYVSTIHTRSRYARLGLELLGSSNFIVPGFGTTGSSPIVFEMSVALTTHGFSVEDCYAFLLVYEVDAPRQSRNFNQYIRRFPIHLHGNMWDGEGK
jgi:hypothetical protein